MVTYLKDIWAARYFFTYLASAELKYKFRRSKLGLLWTMINPLVLTVMMSFIFGNLLKMDMRDYSPYIFSGLIVWEFMAGSVIGGCNSLLASEPYIKQYRHPFAIYPLKTTLINASTFLIALGGLSLWILVTKPMNLLFGLVSLPISLVCLVILGWPIATLTAFTNLKYRDFAQIAALGMQLLWYMSPVFFKPEMFRSAHLEFIFDYNPVTHILNLVRAPMLYGKFPTLVDYAFVLGTAAVFYILAALRIRSSEKGLIYYF
jgi:lipopolysaccharide transport system permease protein